jgi:hypothetical protein
MLINRYAYLHGAGNVRPIDPVHSLMEERIRRMTMQEEEPQVTVEEPTNPTFTCPDCGIEHDGICQFGQTRKHSTCAACFEKRRMTSHKAHRDYVKELIRKDKEEKKMREAADKLIGVELSRNKEAFQEMWDQAKEIGTGILKYGQAIDPQSMMMEPGMGFPVEHMVEPPKEIHLTLNDYPDLYDRICQDAKDQVRTPEQQIIFELLRAHKGEA